jgi:hypothetical protein
MHGAEEERKENMSFVAAIHKYQHVTLMQMPEKHTCVIYRSAYFH